MDGEDISTFESADMRSKRGIKPLSRRRVTALAYSSKFLNRHIKRCDTDIGKVSVVDAGLNINEASVKQHLDGDSLPSVDHALKYADVLTGGLRDSHVRFEIVKYPWCHALTLLFVTGRLTEYADTVLNLAASSGSYEGIVQVWHLVDSMQFLCDPPLFEHPIGKQIFLASNGGDDLTDEQIVLMHSLFDKTLSSKVSTDRIFLMKQFERDLRHREWAKKAVNVSSEQRAKIREYVENKHLGEKCWKKPRSPGGEEEEMRRPAVYRRPGEVSILASLLVEKNLSPFLSHPPLHSLLCDTLANMARDYKSEAEIRSRYMDDMWANFQPGRSSVRFIDG